MSVSFLTAVLCLLYNIEINTLNVLYVNVYSLFNYV